MAFFRKKTQFDPELVEYTTTTADDETVEIYKIGGGTLGRRYSGLWGYRLTTPDGQVRMAGEDLHIGLPKKHEQAARIVAQFCHTDD